MNRIKEQWDEFEQQVLPEGAGQVQRQEMRRSFYAGVQAMLHIQWLATDENISEDAGMQIIQDAHDEIERFVVQIERGEA